MSERSVKHAMKVEREDARTGGEEDHTVLDGTVTTLRRITIQHTIDE